VIVVHERVEGVMIPWGLVRHWANEITLPNHPINARADSVAEKQADGFRGDLFRMERCVVPVSGFLDRKQDLRHKILFCFHVKKKKKSVIFRQDDVVPGCAHPRQSALDPCAVPCGRDGSVPVL